MHHLIAELVLASGLGGPPYNQVLQSTHTNSFSESPKFTVCVNSTTTVSETFVGGLQEIVIGIDLMALAKDLSSP
jgi:hypothetical protein